MIEFLVVFILVFVVFASLGIFLWLVTLHGRITKIKEMQERNYRTLSDSIAALRRDILPSEQNAVPAKPPPLPEKPAAIPQEQRGASEPVRDMQPPEERLAKPTEQQDTAPLFDLEEKVGANWLSKLGMAMVVIGVALFLGYTFQRLGPAGKIAIGIVVSTSFLIGGSLIERYKDYAVFGRVILSGGWALAYLTAYSTRHIEATRVFETDFEGLIAMGIVCAGMILHSLKYSSEFFTGFAFGLAYLSLMVSQVQWPGLAASVLLAGSITVLVRLKNWFALETFAIAATYVNHLFWIYPKIDVSSSSGFVGSELDVSFGLLTVYWLIFSVSHFARREQSAKHFPQIGMILNAIGFAGLAIYQSISRTWSFHLLLILGVLYLSLALYANFAKRRKDFLVASTLGAIFLFLALPYRFSGETLSLLWLMEIEFFLVAGYFLHEKQLRRIAWITTIPFLFYHSLQQFTMSPNLTLSENPFRRMGLLTVALAFLFNAFYLRSRFAPQTEGRLEGSALAAYSYYGLITLLNFLYLESPPEWFGVSWAIVATLLAIGSYGLKSKTLGLQGILLSILVIFWCLIHGLDAEVHRISRMMIVAGSFAVASFVSRALKSKIQAAMTFPYSEEFYFFSAMAVVTGLLAAETSSGYLTAAWAIEGVLIFICAILLDRRAYRLLGLGLLLVCTCKILFVDVWHLGTLQRIVTFIVLGISLVLISFLYTKYKESWRKIVLGRA